MRAVAERETGDTPPAILLIAEIVALFRRLMFGYVAALLQISDFYQSISQVIGSDCA